MDSCRPSTTATGSLPTIAGRLLLQARLDWKPKSDSDRRASVLRSELPPPAAIALQQFARAWRALAAGRIEFQPLGTRFFPGIEERLHCLPGGFDAVGALKQNVVADHTVIDQRLIAGRWLYLEVVPVTEVHPDAADSDCRSWHFAVELQRDAFGRLDADDKIVLGQALDRRALKHRKWRLAEFDRHFRALHGKRLARAQVEGDAGPPPIVDFQFHRDISLGRAVRPDIRALAVIRDFGLADLSGGVLAAHRVF